MQGLKGNERTIKYVEETVEGGRVCQMARAMAEGQRSPAPIGNVMRCRDAGFDIHHDSHDQPFLSPTIASRDAEAVEFIAVSAANSNKSYPIHSFRSGFQIVAGVI